MPILGGAILYFFEKLVDFFSTYLGKKAAIGAALASFTVVGWGTVAVCTFNIVNGIKFLASLYSPIMLKIFGVMAALLPGQFLTILAAGIAARLCRWVWDRQREYADTIAKV